VDPTNDIQLVIKQAKRRASCGFFAWANICSSNISLRNVYNAFLSAGCPRNICEGYFSLPLLDKRGPPIGPLLAPTYESICSRFKRKCNKESLGDGFMIYQKHFTIWQSSLAQISKCLFYERTPEILLI